MFPLKLIGKVFPWLLVIILGGYISWQFYIAHQNAGEVTERSISEAVVNEIEALGKLELVKYQLSDIVEYTKKNPFPIADDKILLLVNGEAVGCIDLRKIAKEQVVQQGDTALIIQLPQPELCYYKLNHQKSQVFDISITKFFDKTKLVEEAYRRAENRIEQIALATNILEQTRNNTELILKPLLERLTQRRVFITFDPQAAPINKEIPL